jgi:hypothetical protein
MIPVATIPRDGRRFSSMAGSEDETGSGIGRFDVVRD